MGGSAWSNQLVSQLIVAGSNGRILVYDAAPPSLGHLISSVVGTQQADAPGNLALQGTTGYLHKTLPSSHWIATNLLNGMTVYTSPTEAGPWTATVDVTYFQGSSVTFSDGLHLNNDGTNALVIVSDVLDANSVGQVVISGAYIRAKDPNAAAVEGWHSLGTLTGYTVNTGRYRLNPVNGETELDIDVIGTGANATSQTFSNTLPAQYRPAATRVYPLTTNAALSTLTNLPRVGITTGGAVNVAGTANIPNTTEYLGQAFIPTD